MLKVAKCLATCVWLCAFLGWCSAQAPGDADARCTVDHDRPPTYPDTVMNLMDSYHYVTLLPGNGTGNDPSEDAVWNDRSFDGNDVTDSDHPTYWQQGAGGICRFQTRVCGYQQEGTDQNNWLFTQHIRKDFDPNTYNYPVEIQVELTYGTVSCRDRNGCKEYFYLQHYITNSQRLPSTQGTGFMNTQSYQQVATVSPDVTSRTFTETFSFTLQSSQTGFYIGIQDTGTCVGVSRLRVYRNNCQQFQSGLVLYPDAPAPVSNSQTLNITCVDNAVVSGSAQVTCGSNGRWGSENPVCQCRLGYEDRTTDLECVACPTDQYRSADDTTCQQCPDNTVTGQVAAPLCECVDGYFRNNENRFTAQRAQPFLSLPTEPANTRCTQPPSAPLNVRLTPQQTSITVSWSPPDQTGGRPDLFYQVEHSDPDNIASFTGAVYLSGETTSYTVTGLRPFTEYCIRVTAHNGVSDQEDPDEIRLRRERVCMRTEEQEPGPVRDLLSIFPAVLWQVPRDPNGIILDYQLIFTRNGETKLATSDGTQTYFVTTPEFLPEGSGTFEVEVRARNAAGLGESLCRLTVNPGECGNEPQRCVLCPERTVGLVYYPPTAAPDDGTVSVTTQCVKNAEQSSPSLMVTCGAGGVWGSKNPECKCMEDFILDSNTTDCRGLHTTDTPPTPSTDPPLQCPTCPDKCQGLSDRSTEDDCPSLVIPMVIACLVTALVVTIVAIIASIVVITCLRKKMTKSSGKINGSYAMKSIKGEQT